MKILKAKYICDIEDFDACFQLQPDARRPALRCSCGWTTDCYEDSNPAGALARHVSRNPYVKYDDMVAIGKSLTAARRIMDRYDDLNDDTWWNVKEIISHPHSRPWPAGWSRGWPDTLSS